MSASNRSAKMSCEFFPPRTEAGVEKIQTVQKTLDDVIQPEYYSVTFGAGGTTRDSTLELVTLLSNKNINVAPHISCIGSTRQQLSELLNEYKNLGVTRLVTLRGDIPENDDDTRETTGDLS